MKTLHTQGDWNYYNNGHDEYNEIGIISSEPVKDNGTHICSQKTYHEDGKEKYAEAIANAKLIAAAPELLEACKQLLFEVKSGRANIDTKGGYAMSEILNNAIKKAIS